MLLLLLWVQLLRENRCVGDPKPKGRVCAGRGACDCVRRSDREHRACDWRQRPARRPSRRDPVLRRSNIISSRGRSRNFSGGGSGACSGGVGARLARARGVHRGCESDSRRGGCRLRRGRGLGSGERGVSSGDGGECGVSSGDSGQNGLVRTGRRCRGRCSGAAGAHRHRRRRNVSRRQTTNRV